MSQEMDPPQDSWPHAVSGEEGSEEEEDGEDDSEHEAIGDTLTWRRRQQNSNDEISRNLGARPHYISGCNFALLVWRRIQCVADGESHEPLQASVMTDLFASDSTLGIAPLSTAQQHAIEARLRSIWSKT